VRVGLRIRPRGAEQIEPDELRYPRSNEQLSVVMGDIGPARLADEGIIALVRAAFQITKVALVVQVAPTHKHQSS